MNRRMLAMDCFGLCVSLMAVFVSAVAIQTPGTRCNYGRTRYLTQPSGSPHIPAAWRPWLENCYYFHCDNTEYTPIRCPRGRAIDPKELAKGISGTASRFNPCRKFVNPKTCPEIRNNRTDGVSADEQRFCGIDLVFCVDISCSISKEDKQKVINFVKNIIRKFHIHPKFTQVGGVTYAAKVYDIQYLLMSRNRPRTLNMFDSMVTEAQKCQTRTDEALKHIINNHFVPSAGDRPIFNNVLVVLTDGKTYHGPKAKGNENEKAIRDTQKYGRLLRKNGVKILVVGLPNRKRGTHDGYDEWLAMAGDEENLFVVDDFEDLENRVQELTSATSTCVII